MMFFAALGIGTEPARLPRNALPFGVLIGPEWIVAHSENGPTLHSRRLELDYRS